MKSLLPIVIKILEVGIFVFKVGESISEKFEYLLKKVSKRSKLN